MLTWRQLYLHRLNLLPMKEPAWPPLKDGPHQSVPRPKKHRGGERARERAALHWRRSDAVLIRRVGAQSDTPFLLRVISVSGH